MALRLAADSVVSLGGLENSLTNGINLDLSKVVILVPYADGPA